MATATKKNPLEDALENAAGRVRQTNEQIIETAQKNGVAALEAYENTLLKVADFQKQVADGTQVEWISALANAQANFVREVTTAYTDAARKVLA